MADWRELLGKDDAERFFPHLTEGAAKTSR